MTTIAPPARGTRGVRPGGGGRPLRVAVVTNMWPYPGRPAFGIFVREQVESLRRVPGLDVAVFPLQPIDGRRRYLSGRGVADAVRAGGFDLMHCHHPFTLLAVAPHRRPLRGVPVVLTIHGIEGTHGWRRHVTRGMARFAHEVVVTNSLLHRIYGGHLIPCGVDDRRFRPGPPGAGQGPVSVVTVGEDRPEKQFWLAAAAAEWARHAGTRAFEHRFVSQVPPEDMPEVYRGAQVLLLSSRAEGSPMVVQEALACGLRVVATDVGDVRGMGGPGGGVHVAGEQTPRSLGECLREAVADALAGAPFEPRLIRLDDAAARLAEVYRSVVTTRTGVGA
jgi:teichuronic acid biosynthesis glycosyltransferase TuaC